MVVLYRFLYHSSSAAINDGRVFPHVLPLGMSHARKHVIESVLNHFPVPSEEEAIVRCIALRGGSVCEVEHPDGKTTLVSIPNKFHKTIWISKGSFAFLFSLTSEVIISLYRPTTFKARTKA